MDVTTTFCNLTHACKFSGLTTAFLEHTGCVNEQDWTTLLVTHTVRERAALVHKRVSSMLHVFSVTYSDGEKSCVSSESFRSRQFPPEQLVSFVFCVRLKCSALRPYLKAAVG